MPLPRIFSAMVFRRLKRNNPTHCQISSLGLSAITKEIQALAFLSVRSTNHFGAHGVPLLFNDLAAWMWTCYVKSQPHPPIVCSFLHSTRSRYISIIGIMYHEIIKTSDQYVVYTIAILFHIFSWNKMNKRYWYLCT